MNSLRGDLHDWISRVACLQRESFSRTANPLRRQVPRRYAAVLNLLRSWLPRCVVSRSRWARPSCSANHRARAAGLARGRATCSLALAVFRPDAQPQREGELGGVTRAGGIVG